MKVVVRLGEPFRRTVGAREVELSLADGATTADALTELAALHPLLAADLTSEESHPAVFLEDREVQSDTPLTEGMRLHIVWPVSGGCP